MMKTLVKTVMAGALILGSVVCTAQSITVNTGQPYTVPSAAAANCTGCSYRWLENGDYIGNATGEVYSTVGKAEAGRYVYVRQASIDGCGWQNSNAFIVEVIDAGTGDDNTPLIQPPTDAGTQTWLIDGPAGTQIWSDIVNVPACRDSVFHWSVEAACGYSTVGVGIYNYKYFEDNKSVMCPSPWRVPSVEDFAALYMNLKHLVPGESIAPSKWYTDAYRTAWGLKPTCWIDIPSEECSMAETIVWLCMSSSMFYTTGYGIQGILVAVYEGNTRPRFTPQARPRGSALRCVYSL
jgi:hypothetical protein